MATPSLSVISRVLPRTNTGLKLATPLLAVAFAFGLVWLLVLAARAQTPTAETAYLFNAASVGLWGTLATMLLLSQGNDERAWLFALTAVAVCATIVFATFNSPADNSPTRYAYLFSALVIYFFNPPIVMHMCGSIPSRNPLLARFPSFLPAAYLAATFLVIVFTVAYVNAFVRFLPLDLDVDAVSAIQVKSVLLAYVVSGVVGLTLLGYAGLREPAAIGRRQAWVVFAGVAPWTVNLIIMLSVPGYFVSETGNLIAELTILLSALSLFVSIARYRLFEVSSALRRALVYGGSFGLVIGAIVLVMQAAGEISERMLGGPPSGWSTILVLLVAGMVVQPLFAAFTHTIENRLFPERQKLEALRRDLIPTLAREHTVDSMSQQLVRQLSNALHDAQVTLLILDVNGNFYRGRATSLSSGLLPVLPAEWFAERSTELTGGAGFDRQRTTESPAMRSALDAAHADSVLPITLDRRPIGLMLVGQSNGWQMEQSDRDVLNDVMRQSSAMLENVRLLDLATNDPLTRLPRRHVAEERIVHELERSRRSGAPLSLAMADIDHFKSVNDTHGHAAGDLVLQAVASKLQGSTRRIDLVARWGGEEFMLIFPETDLTGAAQHAEALRSAIGAQTVTIEGAAIEVTVSIGVCEVTRFDRPTLDHAIACVDRALYDAKTSGRNRVATS